PDKKWIDGSGWAYGIVPAGSFPSRKALDAVVPDRPVVLSSYDGHSTWVNTRALVLAGVTAKTKDPAGGKIVREEDGTPQGTLLEDAGGLVLKKVPAADRDAQSAALRRAAQELAALGVTSIDDIEHDAVVLELLHDLEKKGELPVRVRLGLPLEGDLEHYQTLRKKYGSDMLRFGFLKGFVDGVIESKTAYLLEPYVGSEERGEPRIPPERLKTLVARAHADGLPVVFHAIGDAAVRISLDAFEADALAKRTVHHEPDRIEHIELLALDDAPRFAKLGVLASMQPIHATPEPGEAVWSTNLGEERLRRTFPWRALLNAGATLQFGSDAPVASPDVLHGLAVAVTRRNREGWPPEGWNAHQAITIEQALAAYTNGRRIEVGAPADLAILSAEVDLTRPATLWEGSVTATLLGGRITHGASSLR
ncbi:MAG: amidohydrolase, partial [Planctomycetota bacterium]